MSAVINKELVSELGEPRQWEAPLVQGPIMGIGDAVLSPPTPGQLQAVQQTAYDEAYVEGREAGFSKGFDEGKQEVEEKFRVQIELFNSIMRQFVVPLQNLDDDIEENIVALVIQVARHLVRREIKTNPGEIVGVVREALGVLPVSALNPRIHLHPEDAELVRNALSISDDENNWRIEEDLALNRGDCRVETSSSLIDATIDARLSAIAAKLLGGDRFTDNDG